MSHFNTSLLFPRASLLQIKCLCLCTQLRRYWSDVPPVSRRAGWCCPAQVPQSCTERRTPGQRGANGKTQGVEKKKKKKKEVRLCFHNVNSIVERYNETVAPLPQLHSSPRFCSRCRRRCEAKQDMPVGIRRSRKRLLKMTRLTLIKSAIITPLRSFYMQPGWRPITGRHRVRLSRYSEAVSKWILPVSYFPRSARRCEVSGVVNISDVLNMQVS